jgi:poly(glycerol-phosphate) alpha-glucosyltransferase
VKVAFLTPSVSRALGGIYEIERNLAQALVASTPTQLNVVGLEDEYTKDDLPEWAPLEPTVLPVTGPILFGYSPSLNDTLETVDADLLHLHVLWRYTSVASLRWHRQTGRPHLVTINGMLDQWAVQNARWKKRIAGWLYEHDNLREAGCLQVNTEKEYRAVREYGIDTPTCIVPNGVTLPPDEAPSSPPWTDTIPSDQRVLLFLGRIHPKKGIFELATAWKQLRDTAPAVTDAWSVAIVGWDDGGHMNRLQERIEEAGLTENLFILGPMFGEDKHAAFSHADAFVLPSYSEGLPMAILEAWSYRLPVLLTPGCNLDVGLDWNAAAETRPDPDRLHADLRSFLNRPVDDHQTMGRQGRRLVEDQFTWTQVAQQMYRVYQWMLGDAPPPQTIRFD